MIILRKIEETDLEKIMNWRMRPDITKWMNTDPVLTLEKQKRWYENVVKSPSKGKHWMIVIDDVDAGVISFDYSEANHKDVSWGYYIAEIDKRSMKNAISIEMSLYKYLFEVLKVECIYNEALSINKGVIQLHKLCKNEIVEEKIGAVVKNGENYDVTVMRITNRVWKEWNDKPNYEFVDFDMEKKVHHIGYFVNSIEKARLTFSTLGYVAEGDSLYDEERGIDILFMKHAQSENVRIELIESKSETSDVASIKKRMGNMPMPYHICYEVKNIGYTMDILKSKGFRMLNKTSPAPAIDMRNVCFLYKVDVGMIELVGEKLDEDSCFI